MKFFLIVISVLVFISYLSLSVHCWRCKYREGAILIMVFGAALSWLPLWASL